MWFKPQGTFEQACRGIKKLLNSHHIVKKFFNPGNNVPYGFLHIEREISLKY